MNIVAEKRKTYLFFNAFHRIVRINQIGKYKHHLESYKNLQKENELLKNQLLNDKRIFENNIFSAFENSDTLIIILDKQNNFSVVNRVAKIKNIFPSINKKNEKIDFGVFLFEYDIPIAQMAVNESFDGKYSAKDFYRIGFSNEDIWLRFTFSPLKNAYGEIAEIMIGITDISEYKVFQQHIQVTQAYSKATSDNIFIMSALGKFIDVRIANNHTFPMSKNEVLSKDVDQILPYDFAKLIKKTIQSCLKDNEVKKIQYELEINGVLRYFETILSPINEEQVLGVLHDQTENIEKKLIIKEKDDWFKSIFNTSRDGMVVELNETIVLVNDAYVKLYGYENSSELLNQKISIIHAEESDDMMLDYGKRRLRGEHVPSVYEAKGKCKNGQIIDIEITASVFQIQGQKYIVATNRNISERKQIENQLKKQNVELQKINSELDRFVYSASHDLRAPLRSLLGLIQLVKMDAAKDRIEDYIKRMEKSIHNLDNFIQDIIQYSRNSRVEVEKEPFLLKELVMELLDDIKYQGNPDSIIEIINNINDNILINTDRYRLGVILNNILSNAIRYSDSNKEYPKIIIDAKQIKSKIFISIEDNGIGIATQHLTNIFKMFYRAHDKKVGTGLGLYIVKETLERINGKINVESQVGVGTKFLIEL
jgi:PAS domain S-box-containing protein